MRALLIILFLTGHSLPAQVSIDTISIPNTDETYLQYIPKAYRQDRIWPAIFIFDPGGNGLNGIRPFLQVAEEFNYLLFASNATRNGQHAANFESASRMINDAISNYSIDSARLYVAGFSGGSRLASAIAVLSKQMRGVIACGSGFSPNVAEQPTSEKFLYAGLVGNKDMNYAEMHAAADWLNKFGLSNRLFLFDGGHRWPPANIVRRSVVWLERMARADGLKTNSRISDIELATREMHYGDSLYKAGQKVFALKEFEQLQSSRGNALQPEALIDRLVELRKDKAVWKEYSSEKAMLREELRSINSMTEDFLADLKKAPEINQKRWDKRVARLKEQSKDQNNLKAAQGERLLAHLSAIAYESGFVDQAHRNDLDKAMFCIDLCLRISPENGYYHYAKVYTLISHNNLDDGLDVLQSAFDGGFIDPADFLTYKLHRQLKENSRYRQMLLDQGVSE
jgi:predicted esterase